MPAKRGHFNELATFDILKYFPIAYLITDKPVYEGLSELSAFRSLSTFAEVDIPINLQSIHDPDWPERVEDGNCLFGGQSLKSSVYAIPFKKNRK